MLEEQVVKMLDKLAQNLGVASEKIWEWSLLQVKVEIVSTFLGLAVATLFTVALIYGIKKTKEHWEWLYDRDYDVPVAIFLVIIGIIVVVIDIGTIISLFDLPKLFLNPEYAAFQNILDELNKLK